MKPVIPLSLAVVPLFVAAAEPPAAAPKPAAPKERLMALPVEKGKTAAITLRENVTTGFRWTAKYDPQLCKVEITHRGPENSGGAPVCGAPGKAIVTVRLLTDAPADLILEYRRPWEKDAPPAKILYYAVVPAVDKTLFPPKR